MIERFNLRIGPRPLSITLRDAGTPTGGGGIGGTVSGGLNPFGKGKKSANFTVQGVENPFGQELARISTLAETDPQQARKDFAAAVEWYTSQLERPVQLGDKGAKQSLANPLLSDTVESLATQLGFTSTIPAVRGQSWNLARWLQRTRDFLGDIGKDGNIDIAAPLPPGSTVPPPDDPSGGVTDTPPDLPDGSPGGGPIDPATGKPKAPSTWDKIKGLLSPEDLAGLIPLGINIFSDIYGAKAQADAAEKAAKIMADSADKALALDREMWEKDQANLAPYLKSGTAANNVLSSRMGLGGYEEYAPPASYSLRQAGQQTQTPQQRYPGLQQPGMRPGMPPQLPGGAQMPNFDEIAARYQRQPAGVR